MTPQEFEQKAKEIVYSCNFDASKNNGEGHIAMDCLMEDCLRALGYEARLMYFDQLKHIFY